MSFPKVFGYSMTFSTYIERKPSISLVAVPIIKEVLGLGADRGVDRCGPGILVFCSQRMDRRWVSLLQRQGLKKCPRELKYKYRIYILKQGYYSVFCYLFLFILFTFAF